MARKLLCAEYDLAGAAPLLRGHFPGDPVLPGVLQVEAIGQAGALLHALRAGGDTPETALLTHVRDARFRHRVTGTGTLGITVTVDDDGLLFTTTGQTLHGGRVCAAATVSSVVG
jgi:3-hydroxyacyl-[acyl-carrier-protein] dehydratase